MSDLSKYFSEKECACPCCGACKMDKGLLEILDKIREAYGQPIFVTSGYRCAAHNKQVGGEPDSAHTKGKAVDIVIRSGRERYLLDGLAKAFGIKRTGKGKTFTHIDVDDSLPQNVEWLYT